MEFNVNDKIPLSIAAAFANTNTDLTLEGVQEVFETIKVMDIQPREEHVVEALKQGMTGKYFKLGKELTTYDICVWIRRYMNENPAYIDVDDWFKRSRGVSMEEYAEKRGIELEGLRRVQEKIYSEMYDG